MSTRRISPTPSWLAPLACITVGGVIGGVHLVAGDTGAAVRSFALMAVLAGLLGRSGRIEAVRALRGDGRDERWAMIDTRAEAILGGVLATALVLMTLYEWAGGRSGSPYVQLATLGAGAYAVALVWTSQRS